MFSLFYSNRLTGFCSYLQLISLLLINNLVFWSGLSFKPNRVKLRKKNYMELLIKIHKKCFIKISCISYRTKIWANDHQKKKKKHWLSWLFHLFSRFTLLGRFRPHILFHVRRLKICMKATCHRFLKNLNWNLAFQTKMIVSSKW